MKTYFKIQLLVCLFAVLFVSCNKDENLIEDDPVTTESSLKNDETVVKVTHTYEYYDEKFSVIYVLDTEEGEVLEVAGDVEMAEKVFAREDSPEGLLFVAPEKGAEETSIAIKVFDTNEEVDEYMGKTAKGFREAMTLEGQEPEEVDEDAKAKMSCYDLSYYGYGNFYFYYHAGYVSEMTGIRRTSKYYYQDWHLGGYNDHMSSLIATKPYGRQSYIRLFEHSCYGGKMLNFYVPYYYTAVGVPNLSYYRLSGWWWWKKSWNDKTSSYRVWSW